MARRADVLTGKEQETLKRLEEFAKTNNLSLFNVRGSLFDRVRTITKNGGACPCLPKDRPFCPCPQAVDECARNGECFCRLFLAKD